MLDGKIPPEDLEVMNEIIDTLDQRKAFYGSIRIKTALCKDKDVWKNLVTRIELMHKNEQEPSDRRIEYPNLLISDFTDNVKSLTSLTSNLVTRGILAVKGCPAVQIEGNMRKEEYFIDLRSNDDVFKFEWPANCYFFYAKDSFKGYPPSGSFVTVDQPLFPDSYLAIRTIVGLDLSRYHQFQGSIIFLLPKYEARIQEVKMSAKEISMKISAKEATVNDVIGKLYYEGGQIENTRQENIVFHEETKSIPLEFTPNYLEVYLLSRKSGKSLDHRTINLRWPISPKDVIIEITTDEISELIRRGENERIEFKQELIEEKTQHRFVESVVAFSNSYGGTVLVGVSDNGDVVGISDPKREEEKIRNILRSKCAPIVEPDIKTRLINEKSILVVQVKEGEKKPYTFREKGVYVRSGSTNRVATPDELDEIYERKRSESAGTRRHNW